MTPLRRRRADDPLAGSLDPVYPQQSVPEEVPRARPVEQTRGTPPRAAGPAPKAPSAMRRFGEGLATRASACCRCPTR